MQISSYYNFTRIFLTVIMAVCLRIAPWPGLAATLNPDWILLVLIYWSIAIPERVGIFHAWIIGLFTDVLTGRPLGQHALAYSLVIYFCLILHKRFRQFPLPQQAFFILICLLSTQMLLFWLKNIQQPTQPHTSFWQSVLVGTLCWPLVYSTLRRIRLSRRSG